MPEFNQSKFRKTREMQRRLENDYEEFKKLIDEDGFIKPSYDLINDFGREADRLFREAIDCKDAHDNILDNAKISEKKKEEYISMRDNASDIGFQVKQVYDQNINNNTLIGNDSESDRYLLDGFKINK